MTTHTNTPDLDDGYALDLTGPVQHIAAELSKAGSAPVPIEDLAAGYSHFAGDLARVRKHEGLADDREATIWLMQRAAGELAQNGPRGRTQLTAGDGHVSLAPGVTVEDLRWRGNPVYPPQDIHQVLGDPFNPMSGRYASNVRKNTGKDDLGDLELSMRAVGWIPGSPAVKDARTGVTITGHRRLRVAAKLRAEGIDIRDNVLYVNFEVDGPGDPADAHRLDVALASNFGFRKITPEERAETALWLSEQRNLTQQQIAAVLGVSQQTISRDLNKIITQMGDELEPLIAAAQAAIRRGLTQSQFGVERGMANNSMTLAKAFAVAQDRIRQAAAAEIAASAPPTTSDAVQDAIREAEETLPDTPVTREIDEFLDDPSAGTTHERPERQGLEDIEDPEPPAPAPRPAVNPPQNLPPAPQPYAPQDEAAQAYDQQLDDWTWDDKSQRWVVQRGTAWVTVRLPQDTPPVFPAHLFGVQLARPAE